jgi:hypothetical protein
MAGSRGRIPKDVGEAIYNLRMAHWNEQRDKERLAKAREISLAIPFKELLYIRA